MKTLKINHLAILTIVVLGQAIPAGWYNLFADQWMEFTGLTLADAEASASATPYIASIIKSVVFAYVLAWLFRRMSIESSMDGLKTALLMGISFSLLNHITLDMFSLRPYGLSWINSGVELIMWALAGLILGGWRKYETES
jgi:hypothetical protein